MRYERLQRIEAILDIVPSLLFGVQVGAARLARTVGTRRARATPARARRCGRRQRLMRRHHIAADGRHLPPPYWRLSWVRGPTLLAIQLVQALR